MKFFRDLKRQPVQTTIAWLFYAGGAVYLLVSWGPDHFFRWASSLSPMLLGAAAASAETQPTRIAFAAAAFAAILAVGFFVSWVIPAIYGAGLAMLVLSNFALARYYRWKLQRELRKLDH